MWHVTSIQPVSIASHPAQSVWGLQPIGVTHSVRHRSPVYHRANRYRHTFTHTTHTQTHTSTHTWLQFPRPAGFGLPEETGATGWNPRSYKESTESPHSKAPAGQVGALLWGESTNNWASALHSCNNQQIFCLDALLQTLLGVEC